MSEEPKPQIKKPVITPPSAAAPPLRKNLETPPKKKETLEEAFAKEEDTGPASGVPLKNRVIGFLIDCVFAIGLSVVLGVLPDFLGRILGYVPLLYLIFRDTLPFLNGRSIGKSLMQYQAVKEDGSSLAGDWKTGVLRNGAFLFPLMPFIELAILLKKEDGPEQGIRLGDEWAKTHVVSTAPPPKSETETEDS